MTESNNDFRILIIDDNPHIHADFIKILTLDHEQNHSQLNAIERQIFANAEETKQSQADNGANIKKPRFEIDTSSRGQDGVEKIRQAVKEGKPYALAFVDIRMPQGWDGIETIKHIWQVDKNVQIVICTAYSDYSWEETIQELGMSDNMLILKKPFDNSAVRQLAFSLTKKWRSIHEQQNYTSALEKEIIDRTNSLQETVSEIKATLESSADGILVVTNKGIVTDYNTKFTEMWDIPEKILKTNRFSEYVAWMSNKMNEQNKLSTDINDLAKNAAQIRCEEVTLNDGHVFEYYTQPHELKERIVGRVWSFRDITQRKILEKALEYQATHDNLTSLPNRLLLTDRIQHAIKESIRKGTLLAVLYLDIDRFKRVNDSLSRAAGDELLNKIAARIDQEVRDSDTLARLGGDEFVLIMPDLVDKRLVIEIVNRLLAAVSLPFEVNGRTIHITACVGISIYPKDGTTPEELLRNADLAMYIAKREGSNKFQFYEQKLNEESLMRLEKEIELRRAIDNNEFVLHYQPQINTYKNQLIGVEALVRWQHPLQGLISPIEFLPIAEDSDLIIEIGKWVVNTACKQNKMWQNAGYPPVRVAINVSNRQINDRNFVQIVRDALSNSGLDPKYLEVEITEETVINNEKVIQIIKEVSELGVRIAFDDFGTGNSSLNYLRIVPIDQLKIDRSFIKNINNNKSDEIIIRAILSMAHELNLDVIAEGVETGDQLEFLHKNKCYGIQGFYFSKPLTAEDVVSFFHRQGDKEG